MSPHDAVYILALAKVASEKKDHGFRNALLGGTAGGAAGALTGSLYAGYAARKAVEGGMGKLHEEAKGVATAIKGKLKEVDPILQKAKAYEAQVGPLIGKFKDFKQMSLLKKLRYIMKKGR